MPIYEYRCENGHTFEAMHSMSADPVSACEQCGAPVERVFHPIAVHFKGSGFYTTDYARKGSGKAGGDGAGAKDEASKGEGGSKGEGSGGSEKKAETKSSSEGTKANKGEKAAD